ncbi:DUF3137 domain-containing protein [Pedobacter petrophilus]|uniref:DUF3137 domain-containing protein n=1 Tax=Pedobacter petrophilus TaxID=1908241 RepID=A0A7K0G217_9SPHI|nr:DUF3137 domain-containing protein [Pedobacter petrophilus]MRX77414.1 DUF3137 domain-containing protein [Pedobacter petrophilus]
MQDFLAGNVALQNTLATMEVERRKVAAEQKRGIIYIGIGIGVCIVGLLLGLLFWAVLAGLIPVIYGIIVLVKIREATKAYERAYKQNVIGEALKFIDPNLTINPLDGISSDEFSYAQLFNKQIDRYKTEDLVSGKIDKTSFYFAEVHAEYKTERETKDGTKTSWIDIFRGIVFVADFNKHLSGVTIVKPKDLVNTVGSWFSKNIFSFSDQHVIQLENPAFDRTFVTYGTHQIESRYVLTPAMMERILYLNANALQSISLSFIESKMYIAFPLDRNYFEAPIFESLLNPVSLNTDINTIRFLCDIVKELDLNTRIWGKE